MVGQRLTGVARRVGDRLDFLLLGHDAPEGATLIKQVALLHAVYSTHNRLRHGAADSGGAANEIRNQLRGLLVRHPSLRAAFPDALPLI